MSRDELPSGSQWPIEVDKIFGCWLFAGTLDRDGYGIVWKGRGSRPARAHRLLWEMRRGPIPEGMELDHTCRRRNCLRHLELASRVEQERRKRWRNRVKPMRCADGHDLALHAMVTPEGGRICRLCSREPGG